MPIPETVPRTKQAHLTTFHLKKQKELTLVQLFIGYKAEKNPHFKMWIFM
jgi:hypothetical protein